MPPSWLRRLPPGSALKAELSPDSSLTADESYTETSAAGLT
jgi:hypothetical protein